MKSKRSKACDISQKVIEIIINVFIAEDMFQKLMQMLIL